MAYLSLYRKHRPSTFDEVVGQEHVTRTLVNAIAEDRLHHAYLFTGQRGTGKTSTARILAAAVNCEQGPTTEPCGQCEQCTSIIAGNNVDVIELDMASHGGVDDARELRDRAVFAPAAARKKVYILDEVHMASTAAFNALLKVVEEPPSHVLFAMATTDPQKVLPTIMSRVQRLDLRRVPSPALTAHLRHLGEVEGFTLDDEAAAGVTAAGDGSVRDSLSVLEQVLAFASQDRSEDDDVLHVTGDHVTRVLGATPFELTAQVVDAIADADVAAALTAVQGLLDGGHDLRRFSLDLARHLRDLLVLAAAPDVDGLVDTTAERRDRLAGQATRFGTDTLVRAVQLVGEVLVEQRQGPPRLPLELAVARLATPGADGDVLALADRVARLEQARQAAPAATTADQPQPAVHQQHTVPESESVADAGGAVEQDQASEGPQDDAGPDEDGPADDDGPAAADDAATSDGAADDETDDADDPAQLAGRAAALADESGERPDPTPISERPGTTTVERDLPQPPPGQEDLTTIADAWDTIIDVVGEESRRAKAFYEPATPARLGNGVLLLSYPSDKRFHAEQGKSGEMTAHLAEAIEQTTGLDRVKIDVQLAADGPRRPSPPPAGGSADGDEDGPSPAEVAAVAESEQADESDELDPDEVEQLLQGELGAERLDD